MVTYIGSAGGVDTATMPSHQSGDLIVAWAFRDGSTTPPALASGQNRMAWKIAASSSEAVGTFTNANAVVVAVYRPGSGETLGIGVSAQGGANSTTVTWPGLTLSVTDGTSWVLGMTGARDPNATIGTPFTGMVNRIDYLNTGICRSVLHDTDGGVSSWSTGTQNTGGGSSWRAAVVEMTVTGAAAITEANDTSSSTATVAIVASAAITEADDTLSSTALIVSGIIGQADITEANDTVASAATLAIQAAASITESNDAVSSSGALAIVGAASITEADDTLSATGEEPFSGITGNAAITEAPDTLSATLEGEPFTVGVANITEAPDTLSATYTILGITVSDKLAISDTKNPQIMRQKVNRLLELYAPGFGDALPDASLSPNGRLFYVGTQGYQNRNGLWVAI
jgi:hypothetical protein